MQTARLGMNGIGNINDELRKKYDSKSASICQAHISLSEALTDPLTDTQLRDLKGS